MLQRGVAPRRRRAVPRVPGGRQARHEARWLAHDARLQFARDTLGKRSPRGMKAMTTETNLLAGVLSYLKKNGNHGHIVSGNPIFQSRRLRRGRDPRDSVT